MKHVERALRFPDDSKPISRFVAVGRARETEISDDLFVVEEDPPVRRVMRRIFPAVSAHGGWRKSLATAVPLLAQPPRGIAQLLEIGVDAEERLCLIFEEQRALPPWLTLPRSLAEASRLALDAVAALEPVRAVLGAALARLETDDVAVSADGDLLVGGAALPALPPELGRGRDLHEGPLAMQTVMALVTAWGFPLPVDVRNDPDPRVRYRVIAQSAAPDLPYRIRPPGIADARRFLDMLGDFDIDELARVQAALALSRTHGLEEEVVRLLVRCLNEPLAWLPRVALEILSDWPEPFGLRVDENGLLRRCPHPWAGNEIVSELGGASVERHCPDCDARVVLPQSAGVLADRCDAAHAFVDGFDRRDPVDVVSPGSRIPLWRGQSLSLDGAVDLVNIGLGRVCMRRRALPGENEVQPFLPGARIRVGAWVHRREGADIVVERVAG